MNKISATTSSNADVVKLNCFTLKIFETEPFQAYLRMTTHKANNATTTATDRATAEKVILVCPKLILLFGEIKIIIKKMSDVTTVLRKIFKKFDSDRKGFLTKEEFISLSKKVKKNKFDLEFSKIIFKYITGDSGKMNYKEFETWWLNTTNGNDYYEEREKSFRKAYSSFKENSSRGMTYNNFKNFAESLNLNYGESSFSAIDENNDGIINFQEFCSWLNWFEK